MKTIVIYHSQTGFTKRYAEWIAQEAGADCLELSAAKRKIDQHIKQLFLEVGLARAVLVKIGWFKGNIDKWADKKLIAFCVGASPIENPDVEVALKRIFNASEQKKVKTFLLSGRVSL